MARGFLGLVGAALLLFGGFLFVVAIFSQPDAWGFRSAYLAFGVILAVIGAVMYLASRGASRPKP